MDEFRFEQDLVRALPREPHPDLADLELRDVAGGWDNQQWHLGAELADAHPGAHRRTFGSVRAHLDDHALGRGRAGGLCADPPR